MKQHLGPLPQPPLDLGVREVELDQRGLTTAWERSARAARRATARAPHLSAVQLGGVAALVLGELVGPLEDRALEHLARAARVDRAAAGRGRGRGDRLVGGLADVVDRERHFKRSRSDTASRYSTSWFDLKPEIL